eukprot:CAMPEP_0174715510 /NCGR_PEP_ID=MMETSP1094-20130205/21259_1 /TAXON_ID=156173 /ORGANISM="Chrysochromulina brevifilum, Strain UTEX LB 985" /LENGTH=165 /DNA_ID=CAMNT_0015915091 /DNA_START=9 /DNA_END=506 /DNA_ORIENTATION=-
MVDVFALISDSPLATGVAALALAWVLARYLSNGRGLSLEGDAALSKEDAMRAARERQQAALQASQAAGPSRPSNALSPPEQASEERMPSRMKLAMTRKDQSTAPAPQPQQQPGATNHARKEYLKSVADRMAKIDQGKPDTDHNPLNGHSSKSTAGGTFVCKKKGG